MTSKYGGYRRLNDEYFRSMAEWALGLQEEYGSKYFEMWQFQCDFRLKHLSWARSQWTAYDKNRERLSLPPRTLANPNAGRGAEGRWTLAPTPAEATNAVNQKGSVAVGIITVIGNDDKGYQAVVDGYESSIVTGNVELPPAAFGEPDSIEGSEAA